MIYLLPLFLLIIGCVAYDKPDKRNKGIGLWIILYMALVLIFGLRYKVGGDTYNYMTFFLWSPNLESWQPINTALFEPGFTLFTSAIKSFTDNIYIYQTIISALMTFLLMSFVSKNTDYKFLAMLFVFVAMYFYFSTEIIRESLAVGLLLTAYPLLEKRKYFSYYTVCFLILSFHFSGAICMLLPFFRHLKFDKKFALLLLGFIMMGTLLSVIMERMAGFFIFQKLLRYAEHNHVGYAWCGFRFLYFSLLPMIALYICKNTFHLKMKYENLICLQILMGFGLWFVPIVFQRLINYTIIFYLVALAKIIGTVVRDKKYRSHLSVNIRSSRTLLANVFLILTLVAHSSYYIHLHFYDRYIPYHSIMDPIEESIREKYVAGQE